MKNILIALFIGAFIILSCSQNNTKPVENKEVRLQNHYDTVSYALGVDFANELRNNGFKDINYDAFEKGFNEEFYGSNSFLKYYEADQIKIKYYRSLFHGMVKRNKEEAERFLSDNKNKKDVITTESGLQYIVLSEGDGNIPKEDSEVKVHYTGTFIDGRIFDSSLENEEPAQFKVKGVIPGWTEALQLMRVGSKWKLFIPPHIGYGTQVRPGGIIQPNQLLIFEVELLEIVE